MALFERDLAMTPGVAAFVSAIFLYLSKNCALGGDFASGMGVAMSGVSVELDVRVCLSSSKRNDESCEIRLPSWVMPLRSALRRTFHLELSGTFVLDLAEFVPSTASSCLPEKLTVRGSLSSANPVTFFTLSSDESARPCFWNASTLSGLGVVLTTLRGPRVPA